MRDLFPTALRHMKPRRPKPPSKYIRAAFDRKIERPKTTFEFDDALDVSPPGNDMRPRQRMPRPTQRRQVSSSFAEELARTTFLTRRITRLRGFREE